MEVGLGRCAVNDGVMTTPSAVLTFWFDELAPEQLFARDDAVDAQIARRFGKLHAELASAVPSDWTATPRSLLATVIVLDQFSRNLFRDDARAFAQDAEALALAQNAMSRGWDTDLSAQEKQFLYMPLMHSEVLADVDRCIALMHATGHAAGEAFARRHAAVIALFGRYPARNVPLAREMTPEEKTFLAANPHGF
jgi:uncharacterized protein (DUF924 family)